MHSDQMRKDGISEPMIQALYYDFVANYMSRPGCAFLRNYCIRPDPSPAPKKCGTNSPPCGTAGRRDSDVFYGTVPQNVGRLASMQDISINCPRTTMLHYTTFVYGTSRGAWSGGGGRSLATPTDLTTS